MAAEKNSGLINVPSNQSVDETVEKLKAILQSKGITSFRAHRAQRRSNQGRDENATDQTADFREPERRYAGDASGSEMIDAS
jgi:hypothetical protein